MCSKLFFLAWVNVQNMEQASTITPVAPSKATDLFPAYLVRLESFFLFCSALLIFFAPPAALSILCVSGLALLWLSASRVIAEYRNTKKVSRQKPVLMLVSWGYPVLPWISLAVHQLIDLPSPSELVFWGIFFVLALGGIMFRRIELSRFDEDKTRILGEFQAAAKERYRGWVVIYLAGAVSAFAIWVALFVTVFSAV